MRTLLLAALVAALAIPQESRNFPGLAIAIVEAALPVVGLGPNAMHPPVTSGPFYIDGPSFVRNFDWLMQGRGSEIRDTLIALGYASAATEDLLRQEVDSLGYPHHWLADDAIILRLDGMNTSRREVDVDVTFYYTKLRELPPVIRTVCPLILRMRLLLEDGEWNAVERNIVGQC